MAVEVRNAVSIRVHSGGDYPETTVDVQEWHNRNGVTIDVMGRSEEDGGRMLVCNTEEAEVLLEALNAYFTVK